MNQDTTNKQQPPYGQSDERSDLSQRASDALLKAKAGGAPPPTRAQASSRTVHAILAHLREPEADPTPSPIQPTLSEEYEQSVLDALEARRMRQPIVSRVFGPQPEHPTARLIREGIASIREGVPSETFLGILELMATLVDNGNGDTGDLLHAIAPHLFPRMDRQLQQFREAHRTAQLFVKYVSENKDRDFTETRWKFLELHTAKREDGTSNRRTLERHLELFDLNFSGEAGRRRTQSN